MKKLLLSLFVLIGSLSTFSQQSPIQFIVYGNINNTEYLRIMKYVTELDETNDLEIISVNRSEFDPNTNNQTTRWMIEKQNLYNRTQPFFTINGNLHDIHWTVWDTAIYLRSLMGSYYKDSFPITFDVYGITHDPYRGSFRMYEIRYIVNGHEKINIPYKVHIVFTENNIMRDMFPNWQGTTDAYLASLDIPYDTGYMNTKLISSDWQNLRLVIFAELEDGTVVGCKGIDMDDLNITAIQDIAINFTVYPNPVTDYLYIDGNFKEVAISNLMGSIVYRGNEKQIDLSELSTGLYFIRIDQVVKQFIKI